jgi:hypothetical protein
VIARGNPTDTFAYLLNNAGTFVAAHDGQSEWKVTCCEVLI